MPFGRRQPKLTPDDMVMAVSQHGRDQGLPEMEKFQSMLWNRVGVPGELGRDSDTNVLRSLIRAPLKEHEAAVVWIVSELVRVAIVKREFDGLADAVSLAAHLGFRFETYLRVTGTIFLDVEPWDIGRGQGYREFKPLPGTTPLDVGEAFISVGEWFRLTRGSYGISSDFIKTLRQQFESGDYRPPPTLVCPAAIAEPDRLPNPPVIGWSQCPNCSGALKAVERVTECLSCRHIWCDPHDRPLLDDSGKLVGTDARMPDFGSMQFYDSVAVYIRGPREGVPPLPD